MLHALSDRSLIAVAPPTAKVNNASLTVVNPLDTIGGAWARFRLLIGFTDIAYTAWKIQECDTSGGTYTDVPNSLASGSTGDGRLPQATDGNGIFDIDINLKGRKRFMKPVATVGNGTTGSTACVLAETMIEGEPGKVSGAAGQAALNQANIGRIVC